MFTVPVHQNNMNFNLKVTSDLPYPVSLVSMTWEGQLLHHDSIGGPDDY